MATQHCGYDATFGCNFYGYDTQLFPRNRKGENHGNWNRFFVQKSSRKLCPPMEARSSSTNTTRDCQRLWGRGLAIRGFMACLLLRGVANLDDLSVHHGLLNWTLRVAIAHTYGGVKDERHSRRECTLKQERQSKKERLWRSQAKC